MVLINLFLKKILLIKAFLYRNSTKHVYMNSLSINMRRFPIGPAKFRFGMYHNHSPVHVSGKVGDDSLMIFPNMKRKQLLSLCLEKFFLLWKQHATEKPVLCFAAL
jgi:hypothetical protein